MIFPALVMPRRLLTAAFTLGFMLPWAVPAAGKPSWLPVTPAELAETRPQINPDAPAEVIFWNMQVDDADQPTRIETQYIRFKVFAPDRADQLANIFALGDAKDYDTELSARLTLPDGTTKEFGKESIRERPLVKSGAERSLLGRIFAMDYQSVQEKFLAVPGLEAGAVLEFQWKTRSKAVYLGDLGHLTGWILQPDDLPVRALKLTLIPPDSSRVDRRVFLFNTDPAKVQLKRDDKDKIFTIEAHDLPSLMAEPLAGTIYDRTPTVFLGYEPFVLELEAKHIRTIVVDVKKNGPWANLAARWLLIEEGNSARSKIIDKYAMNLVQGAATPLEKAKLIHDKVSALYRDFARALKTRKPDDVRNADRGWVSLELMLQRDDDHAHLQIHEGQYLWLELALNRAAGLNSKLVLMPSRKLARFNIKMVCPPFLDNLAIAVQIDNRWYVSDPLRHPSLPFGVMPWTSQGDIGLLAQEGDQTFIPLRPSPPQESIITTTGKLQLDEEGTLRGTVRRKITGQPAFNLRAQLLDEETKVQEEKLRDQLSDELRNTTVKVLKIDGMDGVGTPLEVVFEIEYPGFAVVTKDRLILRPALLRTADTSPFSAATRRRPVQFPYAWGELDDLTVTLPAGYVPDQTLTPAAPILEKGQFYYKTALNFDPALNALHSRREFVLFTPDWLPELYPRLKGWFDAMASSDQAEIVFRRSSETAAPAAP